MTTIFTTKNQVSLTIFIDVNGVMRSVSFAPPVLYGNMYESTYTTSNQAIADAMMKHRLFGSIFFVKQVIGDKPKAEVVVEEVKTIEDELRDPETAVYDDTVTTKGMAVAYIQGMYGESFTATTVEDMKREAARKWNVIFKNWGK